MHLLLDFQGGTVGHMIATTERSGPFGSYDAEAVARCTNLHETAVVLDAATMQRIGRVLHTNVGYAYVAEKDLPSA